MSILLEGKALFLNLNRTSLSALLVSLQKVLDSLKISLYNSEAELDDVSDISKYFT